MAIDTTGGVAPAAEGAAPVAAPPATAAAMARMSDDELFSELELGKLVGESPTPSETPANPDATLERFDSPEGDVAVGEEAADGETEGGEGEAGEGEAGEAAAPADAATPAGDEERPALAAEFTIRQGDTEVEIPTDVSISFIADGEQRDLPLDRVVRLAQMGYYNEERANEIREFREALPEIESRFDALEQERDSLVHGLQRILAGDDEYLEQEREAYVRAQSPEARAARLERELEEVKRGQGANQIEQQARQFVAGLAPELDAIVKEAPEVSWEEVVGRFNILTAPLMVRGQIPPTRWRQVEQIVRGDLRQWAEAQNTKRTTAKNTQTQSVQSARAESRAAKRQVARAVLPRGTQTGGAQQQAPKQYETAADILNDLPNVVAGR